MPTNGDGSSGGIGWELGDGESVLWFDEHHGLFDFIWAELKVLCLVAGKEQKYKNKIKEEIDDFFFQNSFSLYFSFNQKIKRISISNMAFFFSFKMLI